MSKRKRPNGYNAAADASEEWHGRPAEEVTVIEESIKEPTHLADLAELSEIEIQSPHVYLRNFAGTRLCRDPQSQQLYLRGGDQRIDLEQFADVVDQTKRFVMLGQVKTLTYITAKHHLGREDKHEGPYKHKLGEEGGERPYLVYDQLNQLLEFVGGSYHIDADIDGRYSAGIRD